MRLKCTEEQLGFLKGVIMKGEFEQNIGFPDHEGNISEEDKDILEMNRFFLELKPDDVIIIKKNKSSGRMREKNFMPEQIIVDYSYNLPNAEGKDSVRFLLAPVEDHEKPYVLIVIAQPIISPMNYPFETFKLIMEFLDTFSIDYKDVDIILDFEERYGKSYKYETTHRWHFKIINGNIVSDGFSILPSDKLPIAIKKVREKYYKNAYLGNSI